MFFVEPNVLCWWINGHQVYENKYQETFMEMPIFLFSLSCYCLGCYYYIWMFDFKDIFVLTFVSWVATLSKWKVKLIGEPQISVLVNGRESHSHVCIQDFPLFMTKRFHSTDEFSGNPRFHYYTITTLLWIFWNSTQKMSVNQDRIEVAYVQVS